MDYLFRITPQLTGGALSNRETQEIRIAAAVCSSDWFGHALGSVYADIISQTRAVGGPLRSSGLSSCKSSILEEGPCAFQDGVLFDVCGCGLGKQPRVKCLGLGLIAR